MEIEVLDGTVCLLLGYCFLVAIGSYDRIGMWSLKVSLLVH